MGNSASLVPSSITELTTWDLGGRCKSRVLQKLYYPGTDGVVFVVDSNDKDRLDHARFELHALLDELPSSVPVVVFCNKQDLPTALTVEELKGLLIEERHKRERCIRLIGCSVITGDGLTEGLQILANAMEGDGESQQPLQRKNDCDDEQERSLSSLLGYHPVVENQTLKRFAPIQQNTKCPFAKSANLWGDKTIPSSSEADLLTIERHAKHNVAALTEFTQRSQKGERLDGFCFEIHDPSAREGGPPELGDCVRRLLGTLTDLDPAVLRDKSVPKNHNIGSKGWRFRFNKTDFFVTTFAPCYPKTSSRHSCGSTSAFLLLQPEDSFAHYNLPPDTPTTHWDSPKTIRDKTRVAFAKAGCPYYIPDTTRYPMAEHIVKPIHDDGSSIVCWWEDETDVSSEESISSLPVSSC